MLGEYLGNSGSYMPYEYGRYFTIRDGYPVLAEMTDVQVPGQVYPDQKHKCSHCGQWGPARSACKYCGAPID